MRSFFTPRINSRMSIGGTRMKLKLFMKKDRIGVNAKAIFDTETRKTTVLKGSVLSSTISAAPTFHGKKAIEKARENCVVNNILEKDLIFSSPSTAGNIVTGRSTDGLQAWRTEDGKTLKEALSK